jgi:chlorophyll(ide) b reductase
MAAAAVVHLSVHGRLRRSPELHARPYHRPSLLRCRAFKQEADNGGEEASSSPPRPTTAEARRRRKGPLYKLKAAIQGLAGSRSAAAEAYGGEYQRAVEKAEEIFFSVSSIPEPPQAPPQAQFLYMII